jgi:hypothetical protein
MVMAVILLHLETKRNDIQFIKGATCSFFNSTTLYCYGCPHKVLVKTIGEWSVHILGYTTLY